MKVTKKYILNHSFLLFEAVTLEWPYFYLFFLVYVVFCSLSFVSSLFLWYFRSFVHFIDFNLQKAFQKTHSLPYLFKISVNDENSLIVSLSLSLSLSPLIFALMPTLNVKWATSQRNHKSQRLESRNDSALSWIYFQEIYTQTKQFIKSSLLCIIDNILKYLI